MKYHIDKESKKTAYIQLYEQLRRDIITGVYPCGKKLPSKRLLSEEVGVSVITVEHTYAILADEGYVEPRQRSGYFVIYKKGDLISDEVETLPPKEQHTNHHAVKSSIPFPSLSKTMRRVILDYGEKTLIKSPNHGCAELRGAVSSYLARSCGITARPEQIIIGSGAEYLYSLIVQLLGRERVFALEDPSYDKIRRVYEANGVVCDMLPLGSDGIRSAELLHTRASVLHITPHNSFPSGVTASASKRSEYVNWAKSRHGFIIEDNYDSELTVSRKNEDTVFSLAESHSESRVIYLNTFSKTVAPSIRAGYMVLPESILPEFERKLGFYSCTVPTFEQLVLAELLTSGDFERHVNRIRRAKRKQK